MSDALFPFVYFGMWWLVGGGFVIGLSAAGWPMLDLSTAELYGLSTHGLAAGLVMHEIQGMEA